MNVEPNNLIFLAGVLAILGIATIFIVAISGGRRQESKLRRRILALAEHLRAQSHPPNQMNALRSYADKAGVRFFTTMPYLTKQLGDHNICMYFPSLAEGRGWTGLCLLVLGPSEAQVDLTLWRDEPLTYVSDDRTGAEIDDVGIEGFRAFSADPGRARNLLRSPVLNGLLTPPNEPRISQVVMAGRLLQVRAPFRLDDLSLSSMERLIQRALSLREVLQDGRDEVHQSLVIH